MFEVKFSDEIAKGLENLPPGGVAILRVMPSDTEYSIIHKDDLDHLLSLINMKRIQRWQPKVRG